MTRKCAKCGKELPLSSFHTAATQPLGRRYVCKACTYARMSDVKFVEDLPGEEWRVVAEVPSFEISNLGRVKRVLTQTGNHTQKLMKCSTPNRYQPYSKVMLGKKARYVHRLVALAFIENPKNLPQVNHKDGDKRNNRVDNLEWVSASENGIHAYRVLGIKPNTLGRFGKHANRHVGVLAISIDGTFRKEYDTITEASKELGVDVGSIVHCAKGDYSTTHGYIFIYTNKD